MKEGASIGEAQGEISCILCIIVLIIHNNEIKAGLSVCKYKTVSNKSQIKEAESVLYSQNTKQRLQETDYDGRGVKGEETKGKGKTTSADEAGKAD